MGNLTNQFVSQSYQGLLKLEDSTTGVTGTLQNVQDGLGNNLPMLASTSSMVITGSFHGDGTGLTGTTANTAISSSFAQNALTASFAEFAVSASFAPQDPLPSGVISGSVQISDLGFATTSSLNTFTSSYYTDSGSFNSRINDKLDTGSFNTYSGNTLDLINTKLDSGSFNTYTSSNDTRVDSLINATGSYATTSSLSSLSGSVATTDLAQDNRLTSIEVTTGSLQLQINQKLDSGSFNTYTGSNDIKVNDLISQTGSYVTETESGSFVTSVTGVTNTITITKGDGTTSTITVNDVNNSISSSFAQNSVSSSHSVNSDTSISSSFAQNAVTASFALNVPFIDTGSFATTGSNVFVGNQTITGSVQMTDAFNNTTLSVTGSIVVSNRLYLNNIEHNVQGTMSITNNNPVNSEIFLNPGVDVANVRDVVIDARNQNRGLKVSGSVLVNNAVTASFFTGDGSAITNVVSSSHSVNSDTSVSSSFATTAISSSHSVNSDTAISSSFATNADTSVSSSFAQNAISSSYSVNSDTSVSSSFATTAVSSSHSVNSDTAISSSFAQNAVSSSHSVNSDTSVSSSFAQNAVSSSHSVNSDTAISSSFATNADTSVSSSFAQNAVSSSHSVNSDTAISSSFATNSDTAISSSFAQNAVSSSHSVNSDTAISSSFATNADTSISSSFAQNAISSSHSVNSDTAISSSYSTNSDTSISSSFATTAISSSHSDFAVTASFALNGGGGSVDTGSFATTGSNNFFGTQNITGSLDVSGSLFLIPGNQIPGITPLKNFSYITASEGVNNIYFQDIRTANSVSQSLTVSSSNNIIFRRPNVNSNVFDSVIIGSEGSNIFALPPRLSVNNRGQTIAGSVHNNFSLSTVTPLVFTFFTGSTLGSLSAILNNVAGTITYNAPEAHRLPSIQANNVNGFITYTANVAGYNNTPTAPPTISFNNINGSSISLNARSGPMDIRNNNIFGAVNTLNNDYSGSLSSHVMQVFNSNIGGNNNTISFQGSNTQNQVRVFRSNIMGGSFNTIINRNEETTLGMFVNSLVNGHNLFVTASHGVAGNQSSTFLGRFNETGSYLSDSSATIFAIGTGDSSATRRTSLHVSSSGLFDVRSGMIQSGSLTLFNNSTTGSFNLSGSLNIIGQSQLSTNGEIVFNGNPFNSSPMENFVKINASNPTSLNIDNFNLTSPQSQSLWSSTVNTGSLFAEQLLQVTYGGTQGKIDIRNANGVRTFNVVADTSTITGSLEVGGGITGSLQGTASFATTASFALNGGGGSVNTGSFATTGSNVFSGSQTITGSINITGAVHNQSTIVDCLSVVTGSIDLSLNNSFIVNTDNNPTGLHLIFTNNVDGRQAMIAIVVSGGDGQTITVENAFFLPGPGGTKTSDSTKNGTNLMMGMSSGGNFRIGIFARAKT